MRTHGLPWLPTYDLPDKKLLFFKKNASNAPYLSFIFICACGFDNDVRRICFFGILHGGLMKNGMVGYGWV